jgi:hypothetical protein
MPETIGKIEEQRPIFEDLIIRMCAVAGKPTAARPAECSGTGVTLHQDGLATGVKAPQSSSLSLPTARALVGEP